MNQIRLDRTGIKVSRVGFGTASLHHLLFSSERRRLIGEALALGITHFDTSPYYGFGLAEATLGRALQMQNDAVTVATKVGLYPPQGARTNVISVWARKGTSRLFPKLSRAQVDWSISAARASLDSSVRRLRRDRIDFLLLHEPLCEVVDSDEFLRWLETERSSGRLRAWGIAGRFEGFEAWIAMDNPIAQVIQSRDDADGRFRLMLERAGRLPQFTYGYLSAQRERSHVVVAEILRAALEQNPTGSILVSTRRAARLREIASVAAQA